MIIYGIDLEYDGEWGREHNLIPPFYSTKEKAEKVRWGFSFSFVSLHLIKCTHYDGHFCI